METGHWKTMACTTERQSRNQITGDKIASATNFGAALPAGTPGGLL
jgi:hypothetical protein